MQVKRHLKTYTQTIKADKKGKKCSNNNTPNVRSAPSMACIYIKAIKEQNVHYSFARVLSKVRHPFIHCWIERLKFKSAFPYDALTKII